MPLYYMPFFYIYMPLCYFIIFRFLQIFYGLTIYTYTLTYIYIGKYIYIYIYYQERNHIFLNIN